MHAPRPARNSGSPAGRGKRYTWGYGACPDLSQHEIVWRLLDAESAIGDELTEAFQIVPEQSTAAIVIHHPQAAYFNAAAVRELTPRVSGKPSSAQGRGLPYGAGRLTSEVDFTAARYAFVAACGRRRSRAGRFCFAVLASKRGRPGGTIKIGIDLPVSGADASIGIPTQNGAVLAIEQANAQGLPAASSSKPSLLDDAVQGQARSGAGAQNVKTFIADAAVLAMVGPFNSNVAKSEIPLTNDAGLVQISPSTTNAGLTNGDDAKKLRTRTRRERVLPRVHDATAVRATRCAQFAQEARLQEDLHHRRQRDVRQGPRRRFRRGVHGRSAARCSGTSTSRRTSKTSRRCSPRSKSLKPDVVFFGGTTSTGGGLVRKQMGDVGMGSVAVHGRRRHQRSTSSSRRPGTMANGTYYYASPRPKRRSCRRRKPSSKDYKAQFKHRRRPVQRERLRRGADHDRGDRESDQRQRRQDADARRRAQERRRDQGLRHRRSATIGFDAERRHDRRRS